MGTAKYRFFLQVTDVDVANEHSRGRRPPPSSWQGGQETSDGDASPAAGSVGVDRGHGTKGVATPDVLTHHQVKEQGQAAGQEQLHRESFKIRQTRRT